MSKPTPKITRVSNGDDWEGIYVDGKLIDEGHSVSPHFLLEALGFKYETMEISSDWLGGQNSCLPEKLSDIPKDAFCP